MGGKQLNHAFTPSTDAAVTRSAARPRRPVVWLVCGLVFGVAGLGAATAAIGARRWNAESGHVIARLSARLAPIEAPYSEARDLEGLPAPVVRYFRHVLRDGQPIISSARIHWKGEFNMGKPGRDNWRPFTAVQEFVPGAPGFVWNARIHMLPLVPVYVRDSFLDGRGSMRAAALSLVSVVNAEGTPTLASGALQRYLGEAAWLPTALLPRQGVTWSAIDDHRARATITGGGTTVSLEFRFDSEGRNTSVFTTDRFYDDGSGSAVLHPWEARNLRFGEHNGVLVATDSVAEWHLPSGTFAYWKGRPTRVEYRHQGR